MPRRPRPVGIDPAEMRRVYAERLDALVDICAAGTIGDAEFASDLSVGRAPYYYWFKKFPGVFHGSRLSRVTDNLDPGRRGGGSLRSPMGGRRMVGWPHRSVKSVPFRDVAGSTPVPLTLKQGRRAARAAYCLGAAPDRMRPVADPDARSRR